LLKTCLKCGRTLSLDAFYDRVGTSWKRSPCKACIRADTVRWRTQHPDLHRKKNQQWRARHSSKANAGTTRWRRSNPEKVRAQELRRYAMERGASVSDLTAAQWQSIKALYRFRCAYCGARVSLTQDHVVPLSKGGPHTAFNVVPACQRCNSRKCNRPAPNFQPMLLLA
jgi:5-methylcytosine-specific restriction endonuclease McrA